MEFDGKAVADSKNCPGWLHRRQWEKSVQLKVWRNGKALDQQVSLR